MTAWSGATSSPFAQVSLTWTPIAIAVTPNKALLVSVADSTGVIVVLSLALSDDHRKMAC